MTINERLDAIDKFMKEVLVPGAYKVQTANNLKAIREHIESRDKEIAGLVKAHRDGDVEKLINALEYLSITEKEVD